MKKPRPNIGTGLCNSRGTTLFAPASPEPLLQAQSCLAVANGRRTPALPTRLYSKGFQPTAPEGFSFSFGAPASTVPGSLCTKARPTRLHHSLCRRLSYNLHPVNHPAKVAAYPLTAGNTQRTLSLAPIVGDTRDRGKRNCRNNRQGQSQGQGHQQYRPSLERWRSHHKHSRPRRVDYDGAASTNTPKPTPTDTPTVTPTDTPKPTGAPLPIVYQCSSLDANANARLDVRPRTSER